VIFEAAVTGTPTPVLQWQVSTNGGSTWTNVPGASGTTLTLEHVQPGTYWYRLAATNLRTVTSDIAILTVNHLYQITASWTEPYLSREHGYERITPRRIIIANTGTDTITLAPLTVVTNQVNWELVTDANWAAPLPPNHAHTFTIRPQDGRGIGLHKTGITVTGSDGVSAEVRAEFMVHPLKTFGYVSGNTNIGASDITMLRRFIASGLTADAFRAEEPKFNEIGADVNDDGIICPLDVSLLRRYIAARSGGDTSLLPPFGAQWRDNATAQQ
jgi:hypothetical protein